MERRHDLLIVADCSKDVGATASIPHAGIDREGRACGRASAWVGALAPERRLGSQVVSRGLLRISAPCTGAHT